METVLKNNRLRVVIDTLGAEMRSIQLDGFEFLWQRNSALWERTSPVLFPITGRFPSGVHEHSGKYYPMAINGFAQDSRFSCVCSDAIHATFTLRSDDTTYKCFPFDFELDVQFTLEDCQIIICFRVKNCSYIPMPFSVGNHTGFRWPLLEGDDPDSYFLSFEQKETLHSFNPYGWNDIFLQGDKKKTLNHGLFLNGTRSIRGPQSTWIKYGGEHCPYSVKMTSQEFPFTAFWTLPHAEAAFLCMEPSLSISSSGPTLWDRQGICSLAPGEERCFSYSLLFINDDAEKEGTR